jgi:hypothetical protein
MINRYYTSKSLEDILFDAEKYGIREDVLVLANKLSNEFDKDFFNSIFEAYNILKSKIINDESRRDTRDEYTHSK